MKYSLRRVSDQAGDAGPMFNLLRLDEKGEVEFKRQPEKPELGWAVQVGSIAARSFASQDWWSTTPITEIIEERENYMRFKTRNSEYEWKAF